MDPGAEVVVVEDRSRIVATRTLLHETDTTGRIVRMSVDLRHRRKGFARVVIGELIERAKRRSMDLLVATTDPPWSDAVALYRACGFELVDETAAAAHFSMVPHDP